jgi:predicted nucleic acid-binding protein
MSYLVDTDWIIDGLSGRRETLTFLEEHRNLIPDFDLLIAATVLEQDSMLVTRNRRHFERIPGIQLAQI